MAISDLVSLIPPPVKAPRRADWAAAESHLGVRLPSEYKAIIDIYGLGTFGGIFTLFSPLSGYDHLDLLAQNDAMRSDAATYSSLLDMPVFPEEGGALAFGTFENWEMLYWSVVGDSEKWPILLYEQRGPLADRFEMPLSDFLVALLQQRIETRVLGDYTSLITNTFEPIQWGDRT
jgi:hypothetical protein